MKCFRMENKPIRQNIHRRDVLTAAEYREMLADGVREAKSKYGNKWTQIDGIFFQSKAEGIYYGGLKMRKIAGDIKDFRRQVIYELIVNGILICKYTADFVIIGNDGTETVVDVKGEATENIALFLTKKRLMKAIHGIEILVVKPK